MKLTEEIDRIQNGKAGDDAPVGMELSPVSVTCPEGAGQVLRNAQEVLLSVLRALDHANSSHDYIVASVPAWFRDECAPEETPEQARAKIERRRSLAPAERIREEDAERWSLDGWLHWFTDEERQWRWWSGHVVSSDVLEVTIAIEGWPAPVASLEWMLRASGATGVQFDY